MAKQTSGMSERNMHIAFFIGSVMLLVTTVYAFYQDQFERRDFTRYQDMYRDLDLARMSDARKAAIKELASDPSFKARYDTVKKRVADVEKEGAAIKEKIKPLQAESDALQDKISVITRKLNFMKADYDELKSQYDAGIVKDQTLLIKADAKIQDTFTEKYKLEKAKDAKAEEIAKAQNSIVSAKREYEGLVSELNDLDAKQTKAIGNPIVNAIKDAPGLNFVDPNYKIEQYILPNLPWSVFFSNTMRVDRCVTCHKAIDNPDPTYASFKGMQKVMQAHPRLDLFVGANSKHPAKKFGCSICHGGQPSAVDFSRAAHSPQNETQAATWKAQYNWEQQEFWDAKMLPLQHVEASCAKCHKTTDEVPEAHKLNEGRHLFRDRGCVNCHMGTGGGPEMNWVGRVGPDLRRIGEKTNQEWARAWIENPWDFRPSTKMPRLFGLENRTDLKVDVGGAHHVRDSVEADAIAGYLFVASQLRQTTPPPPKEGDLEKGKQLYVSVGCVGCHTTHDLPKDLKFEFNQHGPDLSRIGEKVAPGWLYNWLKNPRHYWAETKMPNLRLSDDEAADLTSFIMKSMKTSTDAQKKGEVYPAEAYDFVITDKLQTTVPVELIKKRLEDPLSMVENSLRLKVKYATSNGVTADTGDGEWSTPQIEKIKEILSKMPDPKRAAKQFYLGETLIQHHGCFGCHNIQGWTYSPLTCVNLNGEADKGLDKFDFGKAHHDHSIPDTKWDWFYTKISRPRVFDRDKEDLIKPFDRLRMPWFGYKTKEEHTAVAEASHEAEKKEGAHGESGAKEVSHSKHGEKKYTPAMNPDKSSTQVLGDHEVTRLVTYIMSLTNEVVPAEMQYTVKPRDLALDRGRRVIRELNCTGCHLASVGTAVTNDGATTLPLEALVPLSIPQFTAFIKQPGNGLYLDEDLVSLDYPKDAPVLKGFLNAQRGTYLTEVTVPIVLHELPVRNSPLSPWENLDFRLEKTSKGDGWVTYGSLVSADKFKSLTKLLFASDADADKAYAKLAPQFMEMKAYERLAGTDALKLGAYEKQTRQSQRKFYEPLTAKVRLTRGEGRIINHIIDVEKNSDYFDNGNATQQNAPPSLSYEGGKVQPDWLYQFLHNVQILRPGLHIRMPSFWTDGPYSKYKTIYPAGRLSAVDPNKRNKGVDGEPLPGPDATKLSDLQDDAQQIVDFFIHDGKEKPFGSQPILLDEGDKKLYEEGKKLILTAPVAERLICTQCHSVGNYIQKEPKYAPNLAVVKRRLKEDWVRRFLTAPPSIYPWTNMPNNFVDWSAYNHDFSDATRGLKGSAGETLDVQAKKINAVRFFLMHSGDGELGADVPPASAAASAAPVAPAKK